MNPAHQSLAQFVWGHAFSAALSSRKVRGKSPPAPCRWRVFFELSKFSAETSAYLPPPIDRVGDMEYSGNKAVDL